MSNQDMLAEILKRTAENSNGFAMSIGELGVFPNWQRVRVIWLGVEGPSELNNLQRALDQETDRIGYPSDERPFSAHLT